MPYATSLTSFPDIREVLDRALDAAKGIRVSFTTPEEVKTFCGRCHSFRSLDRKANAKIYPEADPMHNRSAYDPLMVRKASALTVEILKLSAVEFKTEEIM